MTHDREPDCDKILLAQADFDGELDAAQAVEMQRHRAACPVCRAAYRQLTLVRSALRQGDLYERAPERLRVALAAASRDRSAAAPAALRHASWWRHPAVNLAAGAAIAATVALLWLSPAQQSLVDQLVDDHIRALQPGHLQDVVSTDQHTVKPWFDGRIDFAPPVKDLAAQHFPLTGGRLDYLGGRAAAALVYEHGKHVIDLYVWPSSPTAETTSSTERDGYNVVHWTENGMSFWAVSDLEANQLAEFARLWRASP